MADDKPFECTQPGCGMRFTNEDHLSVHLAKHEMSLSLTSGTTRAGIATFVADQTPTPSKFLRNCEEMGLFHELSKNPFEEAFKKASEESKNLELNERQSNIGVVTSVETETEDDTAAADSLNTPTPSVIDSLLKELMKTASKMTTHQVGPHHLASTSSSSSSSSSTAAPATAVDSHTQLIPLPGPNIETGSTIDKIVSSSSSASTTVPMSDTAESSADNSPTSAAKRLLLIRPKLQHHDHSEQLQQSTDSETSVTSVMTSSVTSVMTSVMHDTSALASPNDVVVSSSDGSKVYYIHVMVESPSGELVPVKIPATVVAQSSTTATAYLTSSSPSSSLPTSLSSSSSSSSSSLTAAAVPVSVADVKVSSSAAISSGITLATKQRLKAAIQQNVQAGVLHSNMKVMSDAVDWITANQSASGRSSVTPGNSAALIGSTSRSATPVCIPRTTSTVIRIPGQQIQLQDADTSTPKKLRMSSSSDDDIDERRRLFLQRNRAAAARCRTKKKHWMTSLEQKADNMATANTALQAEVLRLRGELQRLKSMMLAHRDCPVTRQQQKMLAAVMQDETSVSQVVHVVSPVNDEAIAMAALSSMADCISSSHFSPGSVQLTASAQQIGAEQAATYVEQISSEQIGAGSEQLTETMHVAVDLSSANVVADSLT